MLRPSLFPSNFIARGRMRVDRTQRNVIKKAASSLAALALSARLADSETLVNEPAGKSYFMVMFHENVPLADPV